MFRYTVWWVAMVALSLSVGSVLAGDDATEKTPASKPSVSAKDKEFVQTTVAEVKPYDQDSANKAQDALLERGESIVPAVKEALPQAKTEQKPVLFNAIVHLEWKIEPQKAIKGYLSKHPKWKEEFNEMLRPAPAIDESAPRAFPDYVFYVVRFPQYPVARISPEPLKVSNVFAIDKKGKVTLIVESAQLEQFFKDKLAPMKDKAAASDAMRTYLLLAQEFAQDGMFRFSIPQETVKVASSDGCLNAEGKAMVDTAGGNKGEVSGTLVFDKDGKVASATYEAKLRPGVRPICQSTKLLDPDPIVRRMARQDLMVMGTSAHEYLKEMRAKSTPELRNAIDEVWSQILRDEREFQSQR